MSTIKISELATSDISLTDFIAKAVASGVATKTTVQALSNTLVTVGDSQFRGSLTIADTPTLDGWYFPSESGTYTNAGSVVVTIANNFNIIIVSSTQTVFQLLVNPISISLETTFADTDNVSGSTMKGIADYFGKNSLLETVNKTSHVVAINEISNSIVEGLNLFNTELSTFGGYISSGNGSVINDAGWWYSDYISVEGSTIYSINSIWQRAFYDADKVFISGFSDVVTQMTSPSNAKFLRFSRTLSQDPSTKMFVLGAVVLPLEPYFQKLKYEDTRIDGAGITNETVTGDKLADSTISVEKTDFVIEGNNLFNDNLATDGGFIHAGNGSVVVDVAWWYSDYILVDASTIYSGYNRLLQFAFYDIDKVYISGSSSSVTQVTSPVNAVFFRFSDTLGNPPELKMFNIGAVGLPFEEFENKFRYHKDNEITTLIPRIILPDNIDAVVGTKQQIFFRGVIEDLDPYKFNIKVTGTVVGGTMGGAIYPRYFEFTPTIAGSFTFIVSLYDIRDVLITSATVTIISEDVKTVVPSTKVLCVGDSLTNNGQWVKELERMVAQTGGVPTGLGFTNFEMIGTTGSAPALREGHSGKTWAYFIGSGSPFWDGAAIDFQNYVTVNGFGTIDYNYILLTWNGMGLGRKDASDHAALIADAKIYLDQLHTDFPSCKVKLLGIPLPDNTGGIASNLSVNYNNYFGLVQTVNGLNLAYQDLANEVAYSSFVEFVNTSSQFDNENNYPYDQIDVNTRSTVTERRGNNGGIHPSNDGQNQIADVAYRNFTAN